jgi:hypothetical protein
MNALVRSIFLVRRHIRHKRTSVRYSIFRLWQWHVSHKYTMKALSRFHCNSIMAFLFGNTAFCSYNCSHNPKWSFFKNKIFLILERFLVEFCWKMSCLGVWSFDGRVLLCGIVILPRSLVDTLPTGISETRAAFVSLLWSYILIEMLTVVLVVAEINVVSLCL